MGMYPSASISFGFPLNEGIDYDILEEIQDKYYDTITVKYVYDEPVFLEFRELVRSDFNEPDQFLRFFLGHLLRKRN